MHCKQKSQVIRRYKNHNDCKNEMRKEGGEEGGREGGEGEGGREGANGKQGMKGNKKFKRKRTFFLPLTPG